MKNTVTPLQHAVKYGAISGGVLLLIGFITFLLALGNNKQFSSLTLLLLPIAIFLAIKHYRDRFQMGFINYGKALSIGILVSVVVSIISAIFLYINLQYLTPGLMDELIVESEEALIKLGFPDELIEQSSAGMTPKKTSISSIFSTTLVGFLISLIIALVLKKNENPLDKVSLDSNTDLD